MDITWLGHACFRLKGSGLTVVTDPFDDSQPFTPGPIQGGRGHGQQPGALPQLREPGPGGPQGPSSPGGV